MNTKVLLILCIFIYSGCFNAMQPLKIISFNIRCENSKDGIHGWNNRKDNLVAFLKDNNPDIICMQEVVASQLSYLKEKLPKYKSVGVGRQDGKSKGEFTPIFYDSAKYELLDNGHFWLSDTIGKPGVLGWDAKIPRIVTWLKLKNVNTQKAFVVVNTHLDHIGMISRKKSAEMILNWCANYVKREPIIICGDFNDSTSSDVYNIMIHNKFHFTDAIISTKERDGVSYTYHKFGQLAESSRKRIDFIFVNKKIKVSKIDIPKEKKINGCYLSDHNPVIAWLKI